MNPQTGLPGTLLFGSVWVEAGECAAQICTGDALLLEKHGKISEPSRGIMYNPEPAESLQLIYFQRGAKRWEVLR